MRVRSIVTGVAAVAATAAFALVAGSVEVASQERINERMRIYTAALAAIESEYVEPLPEVCAGPEVCGSEMLVYASISGMLRTLDPHSSFFSPADFARVRERQEGRYYGIGIQIVQDPATREIQVTALFEGSPAYRAGIRRGDIIAGVGEEDADNWTTQDVVDRVKGPRGTTVDLRIRRPGVEEEIPLTVERDEISMASVRAAFMVDDRTGYVRLQDFTETTNQELGDALRKLRGDGMQRLVLDLRDNPGGPLDQAIAVSNRFLERGQVIVSTKGRVRNADEVYRARRQGDYTDVPLVVLVNRDSASASEIVTGAVQDHDRGVVVGETTFGKALVQSVYPISNGAGLALTTGRYYTPSGRMIQRPWDGSFDDYMLYGQREQNGPREHDPEDMKLTDGERAVYSGGGIEPDHFVPGPVDGFNPTRFSRALLGRRVFITFAERFTREGDTRPGAAQSAAVYKVGPEWTVTEAMFADFRQFLEEENIAIDEAAMAADREFIEAMIHYEVDTDLFGLEQARRSLSRVDPQLKVALTHFDEAQSMLEAAQARQAVSQASPGA
jgi:carboxyl-terminal processing protease